MLRPKGPIRPNVIVWMLVYGYLPLLDLFLAWSGQEYGLLIVSSFNRERAFVGYQI